MQKCWNRLALDYGFEGIFFVYTHRAGFVEESPMTGNAWMDFEPFSTTQRIHPEKLMSISNVHNGVGTNDARSYPVIDYEKFCQIMLDCFPGSQKHYLGFFIGWDNSARVGNNVIWMFENNPPNIVERFFKEQYERSILFEKDFLFINAWNEWGEATYLEPDTRYGFGYLEAIRNAVYAKR